MSGQHYALIETMELPAEKGDSDKCSMTDVKTLQNKRVFYTQNNSGYQFVQGRGLVVLGTQIGMVAVVLVGMAVISSVVLTGDQCVTLRKGEELDYFQFGGSDVVMMFESKGKVMLDAAVGAHCKTGVQIETAQQEP